MDTQTPIHLLAVALLVAAPLPAFAHAFVMVPPARDIDKPDENSRANKSGPCGSMARKGKPTRYDPGQTVQVTFKETVAHNGCDQVVFSTCADICIGPNCDEPAGPPRSAVPVRAQFRMRRLRSTQHERRLANRTR